MKLGGAASSHCGRAHLCRQCCHYRLFEQGLRLYWQQNRTSSRYALSNLCNILFFQDPGTGAPQRQGGGRGCWRRGEPAVGSSFGEYEKRTRHCSGKCTGGDDDGADRRNLRCFQVLLTRPPIPLSEHSPKVCCRARVARRLEKLAARLLCAPERPPPSPKYSQIRFWQLEEDRQKLH